MTVLSPFFVWCLSFDDLHDYLHFCFTFSKFYIFYHATWLCKRGTGLSTPEDVTPQFSLEPCNTGYGLIRHYLSTRVRVRPMSWFHGWWKPTSPLRQIIHCNRAVRQWRHIICSVRADWPAYFNVTMSIGSPRAEKLARNSFECIGRHSFKLKEKNVPGPRLCIALSRITVCYS